MFSRAIVVALAALPMIASASPAPHNTPSGQCSTGELHCCEQTQQIPGNSGANSGGLLGLPINIPLLFGINCTPLSILGIGGNNCAAQPVCCNRNQFNGAVNVLNCTPLNLNL